MFKGYIQDQSSSLTAGSSAGTSSVSILVMVLKVQASALVSLNNAWGHALLLFCPIKDYLNLADVAISTRVHISNASELPLASGNIRALHHNYVADT